MNNLTDFDFLILEFINKFDKIHIDKIRAKFSKGKHSIDYRLELLSTGKRHSSGFFVEDNSSYIEMNCKYVIDEIGCTVAEPLDTYFITEKGKKVLLDQQIVSKKESWKTFRHSFLYPAITVVTVSLITIALTSHFKTK